MVRLWGKAVSRNPWNGVIRHLIGCARSGQRRSLSGIQMPKGLARRIASRVVPGKGSKWCKWEQKTLINGVSRLCQLGLSMILTSWVAERHTDAGITCAKNNGKGEG